MNNRYFYMAVSLGNSSEELAMVLSSHSFINAGPLGTRINDFTLLCWYLLFA